MKVKKEMFSGRINVFIGLMLKFILLMKFIIVVKYL